MAQQYLSDDDIREIIRSNPSLTPRGFESRYHSSRARFAKIQMAMQEEEAKGLSPGLPSTEQPSDAKEEKIEGSKWFSSEQYFYNKDTDTYITWIRSAPKPLVIPGNTHRAMLKAYSSWDGDPSSINEICRTFSFPRPWFNEYKRIHNWTHDKEPFTDETIMEQPVSVLVQDALQDRRNALFQKYEKEKWKEVQEQADKYNRLVQGQIIPLTAMVEEWKPIEPYRRPTKVTEQEVFSLIVGASDWQIGLKAVKENFTHGGSWDLGIGRAVLEEYLSQIEADVKRMQVNWGTCFLFNLGDLPHGLRGKTEADTVMIVDATRKQQYDAVFSLQTFFIEGLHRIFGDVEEVGVAGNHEGFDWYAIARALQERYRNAKDIRISATTKAVVHIRIGATLFILTHGKNALGYKFKYPIDDGKQRQVAIQTEILGVMQSLLMEDPKQLEGLRQTVFVQGDNHFFKHVEKAFYEDMQFGSPILGDSYEDASRLFKRPSQSCLLVSHTSGVKAPLRYYFDGPELKGL